MLQQVKSTMTSFTCCTMTLSSRVLFTHGEEKVTIQHVKKKVRSNFPPEGAQL